MLKHRRIFLMILILMLLSTGCQSTINQKEVIVFGAASMTDVLELAKLDYEKAYPDTEIVLNLAGTNTLLSQVKNGAKADIFISASQSYKDQLGEVVASKEDQIFAQNRMVLIVSNRNATIQSMEDLQEHCRLVLANDHVPAGIYARQIIINHSQVYGDDYVTDVMANIVSEENNVRQVYTKVLLGEADAGIVYASDIQIDNLDKLSVIQIEDIYNIKTDSYIILLDGLGHQEASKSFYDYLLIQCDGIIEASGFELKQ